MRELHDELRHATSDIDELARGLKGKHAKDISANVRTGLMYISSSIPNTEMTDDAQAIVDMLALALRKLMIAQMVPEFDNVYLNQLVK